MPASFWPISRAFVAAAVCCGLLASFRPPPEGRGSQVQPANPRPYVFGRNSAPIAMAIRRTTPTSSTR